MRRMVTSALMVLAGGYALLVLLAWLVQGAFVYFPDARRISPAAAGLAGVTERWVQAPDGVRVIAWYAAPLPGQPTVLYFHGNGGHLANRAERIQRFLGVGWGVYMMSYRGYSGSGGVPTEADNIADAGRAYADLRGLGVTAEDIVLYGESLGSGVAARLALDAPARALVLDAPYTSIPDVGRLAFPFLPLRLIMVHRYETIRIIDRVRIPLIVVHGEADRVVPVSMGREVFAAAANAEPRRLVTLPGARHHDHMRFGSFEAVVAFVEGLRRG
jgi:fermentation-respiration switch protein FrsA (DUF1100 family)